MVKVFIERENKKVNIKAKDIDEIIKKLNINKEEVIIVKNDELTPNNVKLKEKDEVKFLSVISGG
jgi:sulfur carrier protein ThiS